MWTLVKLGVMLIQVVAWWLYGCVKRYPLPTTPALFEGVPITVPAGLSPGDFCLIFTSCFLKCFLSVDRLSDIEQQYPKRNIIFVCFIFCDFERFFPPLIQTVL